MKISRKVVTVAAAAALLATSACGSSSGGSGGSGGTAGAKVPSVPMLKKLGAGEGKLNLIVWAGYAEDGTNDKSVDWVHPFEKKTGCQVNAKTADTSDAMVQLMHT